jgi:hypothetical protein
MASILTFCYKDFRVVCTAIPVGQGEFSGAAEILRPVGLFQNQPVCLTGETIQPTEQTALDAAASLSRAWIDRYQGALR